MRNQHKLKDLCCVLGHEETLLAFVKRNIQMSKIFAGFSLLFCAILNILASNLGHRNFAKGEKDIFLPFCLMLFLFYPLLIYLPDAHIKMITFGDSAEATMQEQQKQERYTFPFAFLIVLSSLTVITILDRLFLNKKCKQQAPIVKQTKNNEHLQLQIDSSRSSTQNSKESKILKWFLMLAIGFQNIESSFNIASEQNSETQQSSIIILTIFSTIINFAFGYINAWTSIKNKSNYRLSTLVNIGILFGYLSGLLPKYSLIDMMALVLLCICCALMIYCAAFIGLPVLFISEGKQHQDQFRFASIMAALLLTVSYHPACYLLRI